MPIVRIQLAKGRSSEEKRSLMTSVTRAIHDALGVPLSAIHVMIQDIPAEDIMVGGEPLSATPEKERI